MPRQVLPLIATVESESEPGKQWPVKAKDGQLTCGCPRWIFNKSRPRRCRHTDEVYAQLNTVALTIHQAVALAGTHEQAVPLLERSSVDQVALALVAFRERYPQHRQLHAEVEALVRRFAGVPIVAPSSRPAWLGGGRAIILRD